MAIFCLSREQGALGEETARALASLTRSRYIEPNYIDEKLEEYGLGPDERTMYDEKRPGLLAGFSRARDQYIHFLRVVMYDAAAKGRCVFSGRGAFAVFSGIPGILSAKLIASRTARIERVRAAEGCDEKTAEHLLKKSDSDRAGFHRFFFGIDWNDPAMYDLVLNTTRCEPEPAAQIIGRLASALIKREDEKRADERIAELILGSRVVTEVCFKRKLPVQAFEVHVEGRRVTLQGFASVEPIIKEALKVAQAVEGVEEASEKMQILPPTTMT